jgi:hypothetical protein
MPIDLAHNDMALDGYNESSECKVVIPDDRREIRNPDPRAFNALDPGSSPG